MLPNYILPFIIIISFFILIISFLILLAKRRSKNQNIQMILLAKDLKLTIYKDKPLKSPNLPISLITAPLILEGNYKNKAVKIFLLIQGSNKNFTIHSAIRVLSPNPKNLEFNIYNNTWTKSVQKIKGPKRILSTDPTFNRQFIVKSNKPEIINKILTDTLRSDFLSIRKNHGFKGGIEFEGNSLLYIEHNPIQSEHKRKRFQAITDLMCCLRDQIDIYSKEN